jgi:hypothetical protein
LPPPRTIVYLRQEPYPPIRPAELILQLMAEPERVDGLFLVVSRALPVWNDAWCVFVAPSRQRRLSAT